MGAGLLLGFHTVCVCAFECASMHVCAHEVSFWSSEEGNFQKLVPSFYHVGCRDLTQVTGDKCLYRMAHLTCPRVPSLLRIKPLLSANKTQLGSREMAQHVRAELLLWRTLVWFPSPTRRLTPTGNSSFRGGSSGSSAPGMHRHTRRRSS